MPHQAEILAVGTELLLGSIANTNAQFLSELLASAGIDVLYHTAVGDNPRRLRAAVEIARGRCDLLVFTGGLGPTYDDMTKETVAEAFGLTLEYHPEVMEEIQRYFDNVFHRPMPACNRQQAMLPQGCTVLHNPVGTAPGCIFTVKGVTAVLLPGVPHECRYLAEHALLPWLQGCSGGVIRSHDLRVFGLTEPRVQELLGDLMDGAQNPSLAPYAKPGEVMLRLTAKGESPQDCQERMAPLFWDVRSRLGDCLYGGRFLPGGGGHHPAAAEGADPFGGGELHRRPHRQAADGRARSLGGVSGRRGVLYQRRQGRGAGRAPGPAGAIRRGVGAGGPGHGGGRPAAYRQRPCGVRHRPGRA